MCEAVKTNTALSSDMILPLEKDFPENERRRLYEMISERLQYSFEYVIRSGQIETHNQLQVLMDHVDDDVLPKLTEMHNSIEVIKDGVNLLLDRNSKPSREAELILKAALLNDEYKREKDDEKKMGRVREMQAEIDEQIKEIKRLWNSNKVENKESILLIINKLIKKASKINEVPDNINILKKLISDQFIWFEGVVSRWIMNLDNSHEENDKQWASGVINGVLDVMKDDVLGDFDDDCFADDFWTVITTPYLDENCTKKLSLKPTKDDYEIAKVRWITEPQKENARINALVEYKVLAEHALAFWLRADFSDPKSNNLPRSEIFIRSANMVWFSLIETLETQLGDMLKT